MAHNGNKPSSNFNVISQVFIRLLLFSVTLISACLVLTSKQATIVFGIPADARYTYSPAFRFFAYANIVGFALSILSGLLAFMMGRGVLNPAPYSFFLFLHDLVLGVVLASAAATAAAIGWVGKYGNDHVGWTPICDHFGKFCNKIVAAIVVCYVGVALNLILTIISAHNMRLVRT